jgi:hypothetical protein
VHIDTLKEEFHVRGLVLDLVIEALIRDPDSVECWTLVRWVLRDLIRLQQQLDEIDDNHKQHAEGLKRAIAEMMPIVKTKVNAGGEHHERKEASADRPRKANGI